MVLGNLYMFVHFFTAHVDMSGVTKLYIAQLVQTSLDKTFQLTNLCIS